MTVGHRLPVRQVGGKPLTSNYTAKVRQLNENPVRVEPGLPWQPKFVQIVYSSP